MTDHNDMMMDLFRSEVESHAESLTAALLSLERDSSATNLIDGMMRAAHSVKGAARIVQIEPAVQVSHVMEDCFVAAQRGEILLPPAAIDVLLKGVDMLSQISTESRNDTPNWTALQPSITDLVKRLQQVHAGQEPSPSLATVVPLDTPPLDTPPLAATATATIAEIKVSPTVDVAARVTIVFPEYLNASGAEKVRQEYIALVQQPHIQQIELNLSATKDIDAIGLAFLDALAQHVAANPQISAFITATLPSIANVIRCLDAKRLLAARL